MNLQVVVIAHGNGIAAFNRHEKFWEAHKAPILVVCPENDPVKCKHEVVKLYEAQHSGPHALARLTALMEMLSQRPWDKCIIYEYDSFLLEPKIPEGKGFHSILFAEPHTRFLAPRYGNPPWCFDRHSFGCMIDKMRDYPSIEEEGFADRFFSALAYLGGVPLLSFRPKGFSAGTITTEHISQIRTLIYEGGYVFHGVKQAWVLNAIEQFWEEAHPTA
jgi:hypothetical protein